MGRWLGSSVSRGRGARALGVSCGFRTAAWPCTSILSECFPLSFGSVWLHPQHRLVLRDNVPHWPFASISAIPVYSQLSFERKKKLVSYYPQ